jgi:hypothetical protein
MPVNPPRSLKYRGQLYRLAADSAQVAKLTQEFEAEVTKLLHACQALGTISHHYPTSHIKMQPARNSQLHTEFHVRPTPGTESKVLGKFKYAVRALGYDVSLKKGEVYFSRYPGNEGPYEGSAGIYDDMYVRFSRYDSALGD